MSAANPSTDTVFNGPNGSFELLRHPFRERSTLRAWDAADAYALRHVATHELSGPIAVLNDSFGALAIGLHGNGPQIVADSAMSHIGIAKNLERNGLNAVQLHTTVETLPASLAAVVIKVPKSLGQLEEQLYELRPKLGPSSVVLGAGMVKAIHTSTLKLFEQLIGPTTTSLAEQKARLIHVTVDEQLQLAENPWPLTWSHNGVTVVNRGGVFSARSIDIGTRFLLENLPGDGARFVDLGCGNGVVGSSWATQHPDAEVIFVDSSAEAVDAARRTWQTNHGNRPAEFHHTDRLVNAIEPNTVDIVANNPPFHDERAIGDATAWDMFVDSYTVLRPGGELRVVGNRHLGHHSRLAKIFDSAEAVASNRKFTVLTATKP